MPKTLIKGKIRCATMNVKRYNMSLDKFKVNQNERLKSIPFDL